MTIEKIITELSAYFAIDELYNMSINQLCELYEHFTEVQ